MISDDCISQDYREINPSSQSLQNQNNNYNLFVIKL